MNKLYEIADTSSPQQICYLFLVAYLSSCYAEKNETLDKKLILQFHECCKIYMEFQNFFIYQY